MSLKGLFDPVVNAYFENKYANSAGGGNDFKYYIMSNTDKYDVSFEFPVDESTTVTFKKIWDYVEPDVSNPKGVGSISISGFYVDSAGDNVLEVMGCMRLARTLLI